jgi:hypothetical protein
MPSRISSGSSSSRSGGATSRTAPTPGGVISSGAAARSTSEGKPTGGSVRAGETGAARVPAEAGVRGTAVARPANEVRYISFPFFGPWGRWYPWFGSGFGWYPGFVGYNPYFYGGTRWMWGRYGMWYDPWGYYYDPFFYGVGGYSGVSRSRDYKPEKEKTVGGIRLKVNPGFAKVYIDGVLQGIADEFDGLATHLELEGGTHTLELRADGYETLRRDIKVEAGRTLTERLTLKKTK